MSYRMTVRLHHPFHPSTALMKRDALAQRLLLGMGNASRLVRLGEQLDHAVVEYDLGGENQFDSHQTVLDRVEWAAGQLAVQAVEAQVVRLVEVGIYTAVTGGAGGFAATAKLHPIVTLLATAAFAYGGYKLGQLMPQEFLILRANRHPFYGWQWLEVQPPQPGGSAATA